MAAALEEERSAPVAPASVPVPVAPVALANSAEPAAAVGEKCDVCGGDDKEIRSTAGTVPSGGGALAEKMVRCSVCAHAAHPTCLGFTTNMRHSVVGYGWQ